MQKQPLLMTKLKNALTKPEKNLTFFLQNIRINGQKRGCSGFIKNNDNNTYIYVNTERCIYSGVPNYMFRFADNEKDYKGYTNHWADTLPELVAGIHTLLSTNPIEAHEKRI